MPKGFKFGTKKPQNTRVANADPEAQEWAQAGLQLTERDSSSLPIQPEVETQEDVFLATEEQRRFKHRFWYKYNDTPHHKAASELSIHEVYKLVQHSKLEKWWHSTKFRNWLFDDHEQSERLENLFSIALDEAEDIIRSRDPRALSAKVTMIKLIAELASKFPNKGGDTYIDKQIATYDKQQLEEFIKRNLPTKIKADGGKDEQ